MCSAKVNSNLTMRTIWSNTHCYIHIVRMQNGPKIVPNVPHLTIETLSAVFNNL